MWNETDKDLMFGQWRRFQACGEVDEAIVSPMILDSWRRSRSANVNPETGNRRRLSPAELEKTLNENALLLHVAQKIMEKLYKPISLSQSLISISNAKGVVLDCLRNREKDYPIPNIEPGSVSLEDSSGTNAINLCIHEKKPVNTWAAEHFCRVFHNWFCSAAPVWNTRHELIGVLNVTLPSSMFHNHTQGMVEAAAYAISEQLRLHSLLAEQRAILELMDEGVIIMDANGVIYAINKKAQEMLALSARDNPVNIRDVIQSPDILNVLLSQKSCFTDQEAMIPLAGSSLNCMLSIANTEKDGGRVVTMREVRRVKESLARVVGAKAIFTFDQIVGQSEALQETIILAQRAAKSEAATLILGESGTGKELFAQSMHNASRRAKGAFITVNCGALPRELVQSELFGYDEGAFTGASRLGKPGKFELADNGTIFLDEIGEMPLDVQVSLLRLLQNGEVTRVGSKYTRHVNVRIIAATNRDLKKAIQQNTFREDLYWRLNVFCLNVPPLRERIKDVGILIQHFLSHFRLLLNRPELNISAEAMGILENYAWPGNVRELENMVERMAYMAPDSGMIDIKTLPEYILPENCQREVPVQPASGILHRRERESILNILQECGGNIRVTAARLGISRSGLYMKLKKYDIKPDKYRH